MSQNWMMRVAGRTYGPYTAAQMRTFVAEGRLAPFSLVARPGQTMFGLASADPELADILMRQPPSRAVVSEPALPRHRAPSLRSPDGRNFTSHFIIIAEMKSGSISGLEDEIFSMGPAHAIAPQAWIASADQSVATIRNRLVPKLGKLDQLFIIDASHDKVAWTNYAPEAEARIRRIWTRQVPAFG